MSAAKFTRGAPREWNVFVHTHGVGYIGTVMETSEQLARCAALGKFGEEGDRLSMRAHDRERRCAIYESDCFDVRPV